MRLLLSFLSIITLAVPTLTQGQDHPERISPYADNPHYLAWEDTPVFLLGAAGYHSWTPISRPGTMDYEQQMDRLSKVVEEIDSSHLRGFVRAVPYDPMNHLHDGPVERVLQPWQRTDEGRYDLEAFSAAWEERLHNFLQAALDREIIVSLELWDDWSITRGPGGQYDPGEGAAWNAHPFNPKNNVNYDEQMLPETTAVCNAPFYSTIPTRDHIEPVLELQKRYVDRILEVAEDYPNVLINLSNESRAHLDWSHFWAEYVRERVSSETMIGEMPSTNREDGGGECEDAFNPRTLAADVRYDYVDIAQAVSGHSFGTPEEQALGGGERSQEYRRLMTQHDTRKPLVVSKDYTRASDGGNLVLWSRFVAGAAAARFHRLGSDHGEDVIEFQHEAARRLGRFIAEIPFWRMHPAPEIASRLPEEAGANILSEADGHVVLQLVGGAAGERLTLEVPAGQWTSRWLNPNTGEILDTQEHETAQTSLTLTIPGHLNHRILHLISIDDCRLSIFDCRFSIGSCLLGQRLCNRGHMCLYGEVSSSFSQIHLSL